MNTKFLLGISLTAAAVMILTSPAIAEALDDFAAVAKADKKTIDAVIISEDDVLEAGAYGYGVITDAGLEAILVTTTHGGIQDSAAQSDKDDASFHNHYVALKEAESTGCDTLEVVDITWDAPGTVAVIDNVAVFDGPTKFKSTHSLTGDKVQFNTREPVMAVVAFDINPVDSDGNTTLDPAELAAVCIENVTPASTP
jgi:hypothetical protein